MKNNPGVLLIRLLLLSLLLGVSCGRDCKVEQTRYEWVETINGESRRAIIWTPRNECIKAPVLIYMHGRGGTAEDSEMRRKFHDLLPDAYVVYAEGTNFDNDPSGKLGWETRFPHIAAFCQKNKDVLYISKLLAHLDQDEGANMDRVGICGHSSGGFFTMALSALTPNTFSGFAALGCYTSFRPYTNLINCDNTYVDGIDVDNAETQNQGISLNPASTFFILGKKEATIKPNDKAYSPDCAVFSYFQNSIIQLCRKNGSILPSCPQENFMNTLQRQVFPAQNNSSAETQVQIYDGDHSWPNDANQWVADYFAELLYN